MTTKERILEAALKLFAERGYDGTGVDLIAEYAGIKGPSLYRHYKAKEELLNELTDLVEDYYDEYFRWDGKPGDIPKSKQEFVQATMEKVKYIIEDSKAKEIRMFLMHEQFRNERLAEITTSFHKGGFFELYRKIISSMMVEGLFKKEDPDLLAMEITSQISLFISEVDRQPIHEKKALKYLEQAISHFCDAYMT